LEAKLRRMGLLPRLNLTESYSEGRSFLLLFIPNLVVSRHWGNFKSHAHTCRHSVVEAASESGSEEDRWPMSASPRPKVFDSGRCPLLRRQSDEGKLKQYV